MSDYNFDFNELNVRDIDIDILKKLPEDFAVKYKLLPFGINKENLLIATSGESNMEIQSKLKLICKMNVLLIQCKDTLLEMLIEDAYRFLSFNRAVEALKDEIVKENEKTKSVDIKDEDAGAPAVTIVEYIIDSAIRQRASDIHIEPEEEEVRIRYRIDGDIIEFTRVLTEIYNAVTTRIKVISNMDISEKRLPQDGKCQWCSTGKYYDLRLSSIPTLFGEKFVIRVLDKSTYFCNLDMIYEDHEQRTLVKRILANSGGIILATGPTGSGKSTTLYAMINELNNRKVNITTIEDPVEYTMKGINQINVNTKAGITFASGLRSVLRQDPDIIMVGEIRDEETALIALRAAITGHLVLSTLHTNSAVGTINRLVEMGVKRYLLTDALKAVISQRLIRKICERCKISY
ncbi:MAG: GspE/PulE family protein, partial [Bacillota bacterium]|nr:GspE/PulE family protein [Bacillota bacterium]